MFGNALGNAIVSGIQAGRSKPAQGGVAARADESSYSGSLGGYEAETFGLGPDAASAPVAGLNDPIDMSNVLYTLPTLEVTGDAQRNQNYFNAWWYSGQYGAPAPRAGMSDSELRSLYYQQRAWQQNHPLTQAHQQWSANANRAVFASNGISLNTSIGPGNPYLARYNAINGALSQAAAPLQAARAWFDGGLEFVEKKLQGWSDFGTDLSVNAGDYADSAVGAGAYAVSGSVRRAVADLAQGIVGAGRLVTNTDRLASTLGALDDGLSQRPSDTVAQVVDAWNGMTALEKKQAGLTALIGLAVGTSRLGRVGEIDRGVSTAYSPARVYRVEGTPNQRLAIDGDGNVSITDRSQTMWLNFGETARAEGYLGRKISQGLPGAQLKSFDVDPIFLQRVQATAVPEQFARTYMGRPIISADPFPNQFGIRTNQFDELLRAIYQGSGR